jgi:hypothetical protein
MRATYSKWRRCLTGAILMAVLAAGVSANAADDPDLAPLTFKLPLPTLKGTPEDLPKGPNIEPASEGPRPAFMAPKGAMNVALNKKVTASDRKPVFGELSIITDGNKDAIDDHVIELRKGVQWVQVDLGEVCELYAILMWHDHRVLQVVKGVVVQTADDPDFIENVTTLYNNDTENVTGLGIGTDRQYVETNQGKLIPVKKGLKTRYLRFYSKGSNLTALNAYQEIEVYGVPAGKK